MCSLAVGDSHFTFLLSLLAWPPLSMWVVPCGSRHPPSPCLLMFTFSLLSVTRAAYCFHSSPALFLCIYFNPPRWHTDRQRCCDAESVDINTPLEICCLIYIPSLLLETLAVRPERDVGRVSSAGTSLKAALQPRLIFPLVCRSDHVITVKSVSSLQSLSYNFPCFRLGELIISLLQFIEVD